MTSFVVTNCGNSPVIIGDNNELLPSTCCGYFFDKITTIRSGDVAAIFITNNGIPDQTIEDEDGIRNIPVVSPDLFVMSGLNLLAQIKKGERSDVISFSGPLTVGV